MQCRTDAKLESQIRSLLLAVGSADAVITSLSRSKFKGQSQGLRATQKVTGRYLQTRVLICTL